jgi:hypothetical protein
MELGGIYWSAIFLHWMIQFVAFGNSLTEKAILANVKVEAAQTAIAQADNLQIIIEIFNDRAFCTSKCQR